MTTLYDLAAKLRSAVKESLSKVSGGAKKDDKGDKKKQNKKTNESDDENESSELESADGESSKGKKGGKKGMVPALSCLIAVAAPKMLKELQQASAFTLPCLFQLLKFVTNRDEDDSEAVTLKTRPNFIKWVFDTCQAHIREVRWTDRSSKLLVQQH